MTIFILALALGLRLVFLNQSLWLDEAIEALALMGKKGPLLQYALGDYQPPLYHFIGWATTHLFGYSEVILRLPSLVCGVLTVYFVFKLGEFLSGHRVGIIAGFLAATNPLLIYYSQEGRTYAMTALFVTASFYYFSRLLKEKSSRRYSILYTLYTILFLWTSYLSWFALLFQGIYTLSKKRFDILWLQIFSGFTLLAWLPSFVRSLAIGQSTRTNAPLWGVVVGGLTWKSLPLTWVKFVIGRITFTNKIVYGAIVSIYALVHLFILSRVHPKKNLLLFGWLLLPVVLGILVASILPIYQYFRVLFVLPAYLLLLSLGLANLRTRFVKLAIGAQLACLVFFWFTPSLHREDWRALTSALQTDPSATIAMPSRAQDAPLRYYGLTRPITEPAHEPVVGSKIYYIRYAQDLFDTGKRGEANLRASGYTIENQQYYPGIQVDIYENRD